MTRFRRFSSFLFTNRLRASAIGLALLLLTGAAVQADYRLPNLFPFLANQCNPFALLGRKRQRKKEGEGY